MGVKTATTRGKIVDHNEWKWWQDKLYDYKLLDALNEEEFRRLVLSCLLFLVNSNRPERSKREDKYVVIKGSNECTALDAVPSKECKKYHENSCIQINHDNKTYLMRCSEQSGN